MIKVKTLRKWLKDKPGDGDLDFIIEDGPMIVEAWLIAVDSEKLIEDRLQL